MSRTDEPRVVGRGGPIWRRCSLIGFGARFAYYTALALLFAWGSGYSLWSTLTILQAVWLCGALFAVIFALVRDERADKPAFTLWHEAALLGALGMLSYGLKSWIG